MSDESIVTCVFCGKEYPKGTPTHQHEMLFEHIKVCKKHPLRDAEKTIKRLRKCLYDLVGCDEDTVRMYHSMEVAIRSTYAPDNDKTSAIKAIHALRDTISYARIYC